MACSSLPHPAVGVPGRATRRSHRDCLPGPRAYTSARTAAARPTGLSAARSELVLGQSGAELAAAGREPLGAGVSGPVDGMVAPTVAAARHRKGVLPRRHVGLQLSGGFRELGVETLSHG